ncbi:anti-sigma factor family protein [Kineococcus xinjiangensis]|uniref:anti-sigma factor family protein n=1 Tax=Kineococcus xinjiangensis TaxID=512762 RepID=UPI001304E55F|nr:zf-HC2 domain-containing protein [Kineococcus xinjiangensis]
MSALVDGRLPADVAARAEAHVRDCPACADAVEAERLVKARLQSLLGPEPSDDLLQRLHGLGGPVGPLRPREQPMAGAPRRPVVAPPRASDVNRRPRGRAAHPGPGRRRRRPLAAMLVGAFSLVGAGLAGVVLLGGAEEGPGLLPPVAEFTWWSQPASSTPDPGPAGSGQEGNPRP